jgi:hypothetical protein
MPVSAAIRAELHDFVHSGWMDYVVRAGGWWYTADGGLKSIRRNNVPIAFQETKLALLNDLVKSPTLYRSLLLAEDYDLSTLLNVPYDFGRYWTNDSSTAHQYRPRRRYQTAHPMPDVGIPYVVRVDDISIEDIDWVATIGCQLTNPTLNEVRLKPGLLKVASSITRAWGFADTRVRSTPPVPGILPVAEGPGFIENFAALNLAEGYR